MEQLLPNVGTAATAMPPCGGTFWVENTSQDVMTSNHLARIHAAKQLLQAPCAKVVPATAPFLFYYAPAQPINSIAKPLMRRLYDMWTTAEPSLITIQTSRASTITSSSPHEPLRHQEG
jgi:hypothetical protein